MSKYLNIAGDRLGVGDSCFVQAEGDSENRRPFIARIVSLAPDQQSSSWLVTVRWYYRPEDKGVPGGRKAFHGERELYYSDHYDTIHSASILGRCVVHPLEAYRELEVIRPQDYFSRFRFSLKTLEFSPSQVEIYCRCQLPENPDEPMGQCGGCKGWFHPKCCGTSIEQIDACSVWLCPDCETRQVAAATQLHEQQHAQQQQRQQTLLPQTMAPLKRQPSLLHQLQQRQQQQQQQPWPQQEPELLLLSAEQGSTAWVEAGSGLAATLDVSRAPNGRPGSAPVDPLLEMLQAQIAQHHQQELQRQHHSMVSGAWSGQDASW